ncbi:hypothetical protein [Oceanivirga salmonicida]|uniref:hypothetical protein n=1 Tax=Oceanivirga salmonicida TaxID=1769291 RepID=UPI0008373BE7|nr:hypothetical protein [Oceanivirga salmonicida]
MKKYLLISILAVSLNISASTVLSSDRTFNDKFFKKSEIEDKVKDRFDFDNDIAVASKATKSEISARTDAERGMHNAIRGYVNSVFDQLLADANVKGPGFDEVQMDKFANEIADKYTRNSEEIGKFRDDKSGNHYVAIKRDKDTLRKEAIRVFKIRIQKVIDRLVELKEGI